MSEMSEPDWRLTYELVRNLEKIDPSATAKLQVHLRTRKNIDDCRELLAAFATNSDRFLKMPPAQRKDRGISFIRTESMARDYQRLAESLNRLFDSGRAAEKQALILGWVIRLLKYVRIGGALAKSSNREVAASTPSHTLPALPAQSIKPNKPAPPQPRREINRETVTLASVAKNGKAQVKTESGEEIVCANLPAYPPAKAGDKCRADVSRGNGKAVKAIFKGWV